MPVDHGHPQVRERGAAPWRVRICSAEGAAVGAGVLLGREHVLTCAHVATDVGAGMLIDFVGMADTPRASARIEPAHCFPAAEDKRGDVALLRLDRPLPGGSGATLRRVALHPDRSVRTYGFPKGLTHGVWTRATLGGGAGPGGEWRQLNTLPGEQRVRRGFSGAGIIDDETLDVLGIVVREYTDQGANVSWMIPVETILGYLPQVTEWVTGDPPADEVFRNLVNPGADGDLATHALVSWLARRGSGDVVMIVVGSASVLRWAVAQSSRERAAGSGDPPAGTPEPSDGIDLAIDASGKTEEQISRRIVDRAGVRLGDSTSSADRVRAGIPPMTIVVDGVDDARRPEALLNDVLQPLAERDTRLLLGFRRESSPSLAIARRWEVGSIGKRLERLDEKIRELTAAEKELAWLRAQVRDDGPPAAHADQLSTALLALRVTASSDPERTRRDLETCELVAVRASRDAAAARPMLAEFLDERHRLRRLLEAYKAKANDHGLAEDIALAAGHRRAYDLLQQEPTDVPAARLAVRDYGLAVRRATRDREVDNRR